MASVELYGSPVIALVPQPAIVTLVGAISKGAGVIVTTEAAEVKSQFVVPFLTFTVYEPLVVAVYVGEVARGMATLSLYQT